VITHLHLVPRSRMCGAIPPLSQYVFMEWCLVKHRNNFAFSSGVESNTEQLHSFYLRAFKSSVGIVLTPTRGPSKTRQITVATYKTLSSHRKFRSDCGKQFCRAKARLMRAVNSLPGASSATVVTSLLPSYIPEMLFSRPRSITSFCGRKNS